MCCTKQTPKSTTVKKSIAVLIRGYQKSLNPSSIGGTSMYGDLNEVLILKGTVSIDEFLKRCVCNRKRHQWCLSNFAINIAVTKLIGNSVVSGKVWKNFEELYDTIYSVIGKGNTGISYSTVYDTAIRMGWSLSPKIEPQEYVYVHRHLIQKAKHILGSNTKIVDNCRIPRFLFDQKDKEFKKLTTLEIEDFLCLY